MTLHERFHQASDALPSQGDGAEGSWKIVQEVITDHMAGEAGKILAVLEKCKSQSRRSLFCGSPFDDSEDHHDDGAEDVGYYKQCWEQVKSEGGEGLSHDGLSQLADGVTGAQDGEAYHACSSDPSTSQYANGQHQLDE